MPAGKSRAGWARRGAGGGPEQSLPPAVCAYPTPSPTSSSSCRIVARPHARTGSMAAAFGVDPRASPKTPPTRLSGSLATPIPAPRSAHRGGCPIRKTCATCGGAGVVCESGSRRGFPASPPASPRASGAGCGPNRDSMARWRDHRNGVLRGDCPHRRRVDRDDDGRACAGKVDDRHGRQRRVRRARVLRTDRGGPGRPDDSGTRGERAANGAPG